VAVRRDPEALKLRRYRRPRRVSVAKWPVPRCAACVSALLVRDIAFSAPASAAFGRSRLRQV